MTDTGRILVVHDNINGEEFKDDEFKDDITQQIDKKFSKEVYSINQNDSSITYDKIIYFYNPQSFDNSLLSAALKILKPKSTLKILNIPLELVKKSELELKVNGFVNIETYLHGAKSVVSCKKPSYEIGSSSKLNLKKKEVAAVWKLDDTLDEDLIDADNLLDDEDLKKPDPSSLRVCGTTGKRKACKDCSCGLAEELADETKKEKDVDLPKSSCGSCYLGDAFRCATCPYLGMPAFKPGEKIQLSENLLKIDN